MFIISNFKWYFLNAKFTYNAYFYSNIRSIISNIINVNEYINLDNNINFVGSEIFYKNASLFWFPSPS